MYTTMIPYSTGSMHVEPAADCDHSPQRLDRGQWPGLDQYGSEECGSVHRSEA
jgi:hypothetical protein